MMDNLCEVTERLWIRYVLGGKGDELQIREPFLNSDCIIMGAGKGGLRGHEHTSLQLRDIWCRQKHISPNVCLVYGGLQLRREYEDKQHHINMENSFSVLYKKWKDSWEIVHIHQSMPDFELADHEHYVRSLAEQIKESHDKIKELKILAEKDSLTNLMNYRTFRECYENWIFDETWLFILDVDKFKQINDSYGHVTGNHVLQEIASVLKAEVRESDVICRMGGDEFMILCNGLDTEIKAREFARRIQKKVADAMKQKISWAGISVGMAKVGSKETLENAMERSDADLYKKKRGGR